MIYSIEELSKRVEPVAKKYNLRAVYLFGAYVDTVDWNDQTKI